MQSRSRAAGSRDVASQPPWWQAEFEGGSERRYEAEAETKVAQRGEVSFTGSGCAGSTFRRRCRSPLCGAGKGERPGERGANGWSSFGGAAGAKWHA